MSAGRTGKPSGAARSTSKRHPPVASGQPDFRSARNRAYRERPSGEPDVRAPAMLEALAPRPRGGTVDTADLKSASGKPECRFESGRGHHLRLLRGGRAIGGFSNHTTADAAHRVARLGYVSVTMPLQNCWPLPVSTSYLRTNESLPSLAMR